MNAEWTDLAEQRTAKEETGPVSQTGLDLDFLADAIAYRLRIAQETSFRRYKEQLSGFTSLHPGYFSALAVIAANPGCSQTDLGLAIGRDKSTLTVLLKRLEREKLVVRKRRADNQRTYALNLTPQGEAVLQSLHRAGVEHEQVISERFTAEEKANLLEYLQRIIDIRA